MRIISKIKQYRFGVRAEIRARGQNSYGILENYVVKPELTLEFKHGACTPAEVAAAMRHWNTGAMRDASDPYSAEAWGAHPLAQSQPYDTGFERGVTIAWSPQMNLSVYDTDWLEGEDKADAEAYLRSDKCNFGGDAFIYEPPVLAAPWPSYDKIGQGAATKIPAMTRDLGIDVEYVIQYEAANKNRDGVINGLRELVRDAALREFEDAALEVKL